MRILALILSFLLIHAQLWAVTLDAVTTGSKNASSGGTTVTVSHTVTTLSGNRAIYLQCGLDHDASAITWSATYAGAAMTEVTGASIINTGTIFPKVATFRKLDPATGPNNWVISLSADVAVACRAASVTNVDQTTPETDADELCSGASTSTSQTLTLTTAADELVFDILQHGSTTSDGIAGANQTEQMDITASGGRAFASVQNGSDGGIMSWSWTSGQFNCLAAVSLKNSTFAADAGSFGGAAQ